MVFENLTLFEVHFEDATFSPTQIFGDEAADEAPAEATESAIDDGAADGDSDDDSGHALALALASIVFSVVVAVLVRKLRGDGDEPTVEIDTAPEADAGA